MKYPQIVVKQAKEKWAKSRKSFPIFFKIIGILLIASSGSYIWFAFKVLLAGGNNAGLTATILIMVSIIQGAAGICIAKYMPVFMGEIARMMFELLERLVGL